MARQPSDLDRARRRAQLRGLYGIAGPVRATTPEGRAEETLALADALISGGAPVIQYRDKEADGAALLRTGRLLRARTRAAGVLFVVNDRLDIALLCEADGVHVGQDDLSVEDVRHVATTAGRGDLLIGLSTHDLVQVREAVALDVDCIGFGPVFPTTTKADALPSRGLPLLAEAVRLFAGRPVIAIGGIPLAAAREVAATGAAMAAVIGDLVRADDWVERATQFHTILTQRP